MKTRKVLIFILVLLLSLSLISCSKDKKQDPISRTDFLMDTVMTIKIYDKKDEKILDEAFERLEEIENKMSFTIEDSDVSYINSNAGIEPVTVSEETYYVLEESIHFAQISSGAYDPTVGPLVSLWDIKAEEEARDSIPSEEEINGARKLIDYNKLELLDNNQVFLKEKDMAINLGAIVKGYATDEVRNILIKHGVKSAIIDLGGNVFAHGLKADESPWSIGIQNPLEYTGNYLGILKVGDRSIVTSGDYERFFIYEGEKYHHIFDRSTGYPVNNEITGVSIISDISLDGDALSTAMFVLGLDKGMELIERLEGVDVIFITKDKKIYVPENLKASFSLREGLDNFEVIEY